MEEIAIDKLQYREPGKDPENPYEDLDIERLPRWWKDAVTEHKQYGLRPYRPSRFSDGKLKEYVIDRLENQYDISIHFVCKNPVEDDSWNVVVNEESIGTVEYYRSTKGYSIFNMDSQDFEDWILLHIE